MPKRLLILSLLSVLTLQAFAEEASPAKPLAPLTIDQVLQFSPEQLLAKSAERGKALADLLGQATDEASAERILPDAKRCFLETYLIEIRLGMLPTPTDQERARLQSLGEPARKIQEQIIRQAERIHSSPRLAQILEPVVGRLYLANTLHADSLARSAVSLLLTIRSQMELYRLQHNDKLPDFRNQGWSQLTKATRADGQTAADGNMGPYLSSAPINPFLNRSRILIARTAPKKDFRYTGGDCGFIIDESTGKIWAIDAEGRLFNETQMAQADVW